MAPPKIPSNISERPAKIESIYFMTNFFKALVLRVLKEFSNEGLTGLDVFKVIQNQNPPLNTNESQVYMAMRDLEKDKLIVSNGNRPAKYCISNSGEKYLDRELRNLQNILELLK